MSSWKSSLFAEEDAIFCKSEKKTSIGQSERDDLIFGWFGHGSQDYTGRENTMVKITRRSKSPENREAKANSVKLSFTFIFTMGHNPQPTLPKKMFSQPGQTASKGGVFTEASRRQLHK